MNRTHVQAMHEQRGYAVALRVLRERKARGEFFVYLENLERARLKDLRRQTAESEDDAFLDASVRGFHSVREMVYGLIELGGV